MKINDLKVSYYTKNYAITGYVEPFTIWRRDGTVYNKIGLAYKSSLEDAKGMILELEKNHERNNRMDLAGEVLCPVEGPIN